MANLEAKLQSDCVLWYRNTIHEIPPRLWGNFNENAKHKLSSGMLKGISDLMYMTVDKELIAVELKFPGTRHDCTHLREQAEFLKNIPHKGFFCDSLDQFKNIILTGGGGISPESVLRYIEGRKSSIKWDSSKF